MDSMMEKHQYDVMQKNFKYGMLQFFIFKNLY